MTACAATAQHVRLRQRYIRSPENNGWGDNPRRTQVVLNNPAALLCLNPARCEPNRNRAERDRGSDNRWGAKIPAGGRLAPRGKKMNLLRPGRERCGGSRERRRRTQNAVRSSSYLLRSCSSRQGNLDWPEDGRETNGDRTTDARLNHVAPVLERRPRRESNPGFGYDRRSRLENNRRAKNSLDVMSGVLDRCPNTDERDLYRSEDNGVGDDDRCANAGLPISPHVPGHLDPVP